MLKENKELLKSLKAFSWGPVLSSVFSFLTVPLITRMISPDQFGRVAMFNSILMFGNVGILLGLDQGFVREYSLLKKNPNFLFNTIFPSIIILLIMETIILLNINTCSQFIFGEIKRELIICLCILFPVMLFNRYSELLLRVNDNGHKYSLMNVFNKAINFLSLIILLIFYKKIYSVIIYALVITNLTASLIYFLFTTKYWEINLRIDKIIIKKLLLFSLPLLPASLLSWSLNSMDKVLIRTLGSFSELGIYNGASKIANLFLTIQVAFSSFWGPTAYKWYESGVDKRKFINVATLMLSFLMIVLCLIILLRKIVIQILGPEYYEAINLIPILCFVPILYMLMTVTNLGIYFHRKTIYTLMISIISVVVNLLGNLFLIPVYGAMGAGIATVFSYFCFL